MTKSRVILAPIFLAVLISSCGGLSDEEATSYCDRARTAQVQCVDDDAYQSCLACYEDCGVGCKEADVCPRTFTCD